jgi:hypothetical protein
MQRLSANLANLVLRFLPPRDKLLQLTHVSRAFPLLTAACSTEDCVTVDKPAARALSRSASLQSLLRHARQLSVRAVRWPREQRVREPELEESARLPPQSQRIQQAAVADHPTGGEQLAPWATRQCARPAARSDSLSSLPLLHSLSLDAKPKTDGLFRFVGLSDVALMSGLRSLRSLTVNSVPLAVRKNAGRSCRRCCGGSRPSLR